MNLYLVRHGDTELNKQDRLRGWLNVPLNDDGIRQAKEVAKVLAKKPIQRIYSSDLVRATTTAEIIGKELGLVPYPRPHYRPINWGAMNGQKWDDVKDTVHEWIDAWKEDAKKRVPGGESWSDFQGRNLTGLKEAVGDVDPGMEIVIVTHLRNCLYFRGYADHDSQPLCGDHVDVVTDLDHDTGQAARYYFDAGRLLFLSYEGADGILREGFKQLKSS